MKGMKLPVAALTAFLTVAVAGGAVALAHREIGTLVVLSAPLLAVCVELSALRARGVQYPSRRMGW